VLADIFIGNRDVLPYRKLVSTRKLARGTYGCFRMLCLSRERNQAIVVVQRNQGVTTEWELNIEVGYYTLMQSHVL
jgi:hypothetical protein